MDHIPIVDLVDYAPWMVSQHMLIHMGITDFGEPIARSNHPNSLESIEDLKYVKYSFTISRKIQQYPTSIYELADQVYFDLRPLIGTPENFSSEWLNISILQHRMDTFEYLLNRAHQEMVPEQFWNWIHDNKSIFNNIMGITSIGAATKALDLLMQFCRGININPQDEDGITPMMNVTHRDEVEFLELLISNGVRDWGLVDGNDWTAMHHACNNSDMLRVLLKAGCNTFNHRNNDGETPLYVCITQLEVEGIFLLDEWSHRSGILLGVDIPSNNGTTPLCQAASIGSAKMIEALISIGSQALDIPDERGITPIIAAADYSNRWDSPRDFKPDSCLELLIALGTGTATATATATATEVDSAFLRIERNTRDDGELVWSRIHRSISEEQRLEIRQRVYFNSSLTKRLLRYC